MEPWQEPRHGRGWLILLLGIAVFAAFGAVVGYAYFKGLPGIGGEPPLIKAEAGPYRSAPGDRGGLAVANTNSSIIELLRPQSEPPRVERILPQEETPALESAEPEVEIEPTPDQPVAALTSPEEEATAAALPYPHSKPALPEPDAASPAEPATISALPQIEPSARPVEPIAAAEPEAPPPPAPAPEPQTVQPAPACTRARDCGASTCTRSPDARTDPRSTAPGPRRTDGAGTARTAAPDHRSGHLSPAARGCPFGRRADPGLGRSAAALSRGPGQRQSAGRADRHHLRPAVPSPGRPVHLARGRRQCLRLDPRQRRPVLHRRADRPVRPG